MSDEVARNTSGRHAGGRDFTIEFRSDEPGPEDLRLTLTCGGLHIARQEDMENVVSQEGHQQKAFDGVRIMLEHMIGVPYVRNINRNWLTLFARPDGRAEEAESCSAHRPANH